MLMDSSRKAPKQLDLSVVIPVFNEEESIGPLVAETLEALGARPEVDYEILLVDDGSSDGTARILADLAETHPCVRVIALSRNFGQTAAMRAGFESSVGEAIVPLDGDGQNDPADIYRLVDLLGEGYDCVSGWRADRQDPGFSRRLPSKMANNLISRATGVAIHDSGCTIKAYNGDLLREIPLYGEMHRLIPFYVYLAGGRITELEVKHRPRTAGESKYGIGRTFRVIQDITVAKFHRDFSQRPMHLFGNLGVLAAFVGVLLLVLAVILERTDTRDFMESPLPVLAAILILGGLQVVLFGLLAEILLRRINLGPGYRPYRVSQRRIDETTDVEREV
jgi:glycosyltransferase involved in cell wall biosynthesis